MDNYGFKLEHINLIKEGLKLLDIPFKEEQIIKMDQFYSFYKEVNGKINLSRIIEPHDFIVKHILDSASGYHFFKEAHVVTDIGTGGGFPGIILAILYPTITWHLLDVIAKKVNYLNDLIDKLRLKNCYAYNTSQTKAPQKTDFITYRALGSLDKVLKMSLQYGFKKTNIIAYKAKKENILEEIKEMSSSIKVKVIPISVPFLDAQRHIVFYHTPV